MPRYLLITTVLMLFALPGKSHSCEVPRAGYNLDIDDLIREANTIVLVRLHSSNAHPDQKGWTEYILDTVEIIKGKAEPSYRFESYGSDYSDNDFAGHTAQEFWHQAADKMPLGRSEWPCCICGPDHSFRKDREYLYFPDMLGSMKSAEVIRNKNDRWLLYVRSKAKIANQPFKRDALKRAP